MEKQLVAERIVELAGSVQHHADLYYNKAKPEVTDAEYDAMVDDLKNLVAELESIDPSASEIGIGKAALNGIGAVPSYGRKVTHSQKMGSLDKATSVAEVMAWYKKYAPKGGKVVVMPKLDGCASRISYSEGKLTEAATRGDGCLDSSSLVEFEDGRILTIGEVVGKKVRGRIKSFNVQSGVVEYKDIKDFYDNGECDEWIEIVAGDEIGNERTILVTKNHQVWIENKEGGHYVKASDIVVGDIVAGY